MRNRSAPGSSTPTSRLTNWSTLPAWGKIGVGTPLLALAAVYVYTAFTAPDPVLRIVLRCLPLLPLAIWTIWFDRARPLERQPVWIRIAGRLALLVIVMGFVVAVLGFALNWLYDPDRVA